MPFLFVVLNNFFLNLINNEIAIQYIIYYTLIIVVFIGALNWNLDKKINNLKIIYGFLPSLFASIVIAMNLLDVKTNTLYLLLILFVAFQTSCDYFFITSKYFYRSSFYFLRLPLSLGIILFLIVIKI